MKKFTIFFLLVILFASNFEFNAYADNKPPNIDADSAVLMDAATGQILYSKNMDTAYPPASTTKTMTALLTLENCNLDDVVTVGANPPKVEGSRIYIFEGEQLKVRDLLYALFLQSANDCAEALAEYIGGGSMDNFVKMMNKRAKELGCTTANFANPTGLYDPNHKMSAKDLALIVRELAKHPEFKQIATTQSYVIKPTNKSANPRPLWNEDRLIIKNDKYAYDGCEGGKTGYTIQSLFSYTASCTRNGQRLIVAFVHGKDKVYFQDAKNLFDYGFENFKLIKLFSKGSKVTDYKIGNKTIPLIAASDFYYLIKKPSNDSAAFTIDNTNLKSKSFKKGSKVSTAYIYLNNKKIGEVSLLSGVDHLIQPTVSPLSPIHNIYLYRFPICIGGGIIIIILISIYIIKKKKIIDSLQ